MRLAMIAVIALLAAQDDKAEPFYKFKAGTVWTLTQKSGEESKVTLTVTKEEGGRVYVESRETGAAKTEPVVEQLCWYVKDGFLVYSTKDEETWSPGINMYKVGSKKGDTWPAGAEMPEGTMMTHMGLVEVTVPAGTYKDVAQVQVKMGEMTGDYYFAPNVGLIKFTGTNADKTIETVELTEFKEGK